MKVREVMQSPVICVGPGQSVESAARVLERYNVGALPVCTPKGQLCGMLTDRDGGTLPCHGEIAFPNQRPGDHDTAGDLC